MAVIITHGITEELIVIAEMNFFFVFLFFNILPTQISTKMSLVSTHKQVKIMETRDILRQYKRHTFFFNAHTVFVFPIFCSVYKVYHFWLQFFFLRIVHFFNICYQRNPYVGLMSFNLRL